MLKFDYSAKPDDRPYALGTRDAPAKNPITVSMTGKCVRQQAYHWRGEPKTQHPNLEPVKTEMTFAVGTAVHEALQRGIVGLRDVERTVFMRDDELYLEGRIDGIVSITTPSGLPAEALLEMKTMNAYAFKRFKDTGIIDDAYLVQANTYLELLRFMGDPIAWTLWVMIDRGSLEIAYSLRPYNGSYGTTGMENAFLAQAIAPENLSRLEPTGSKLDWQCAYCPFWQSCYPEAYVPVGGKVELRLEVKP